MMAFWGEVVFVSEENDDEQDESEGKIRTLISDFVFV